VERLVAAVASAESLGGGRREGQWGGEAVSPALLAVGGATLPLRGHAFDYETGSSRRAVAAVGREL
ncbi:hypothetical protein THAOC_24726, partial [Thalassiosira oceanica]